MGLLIIVLVAAYVIRKKAEAARRKEMDRRENNEGGIWPSDRPLTKSESFAKAKEEGFTVLRTEGPIFEAALAVHKLLEA